ncbi:MAG: DUF362 domain-containing protein [Candidatus Aminicenantes bacterium]|jgi:hypothetical protein
MKKRTITRRDFLRAAALTPVAGAIACRQKQPSGQEVLTPPVNKVEADKVKVVLIRDKNALAGFKKPDEAVVERMLNEAMTSLFGVDDLVQAWKEIVGPDDIVGIKSNVWRYLPTTSEVESLIKKRVLETGVPEENVGVDDRGVRRDPLFQKATAIINVRPARTHDWSGIGGCIKNPIMFSPSPPKYHPDACADLATLWDHHNLRDRVKLNILLMLSPQFHSTGPHSYSDKYVWPYKGILVSQDPVAVDSVGLQIIQAKRFEYFGENRPFQTPAKHIHLAETRHHLGVANPDKINLIKLGWPDEILI